jgi:hypothetical protein
MLEVVATGLPHAEVGPDAVELNALGRADFLVRERTDANVLLRVRRGDVEVVLDSVCVPPLSVSDRPPPSQPEPLDAVTLFIRRDLTTSECVLISYEARRGDEVLRGEYDPTRFDDAPCGPFAAQEL